MHQMFYAQLDHGSKKAYYYADAVIFQDRANDKHYLMVLPGSLMRQEASYRKYYESQDQYSDKDYDKYKQLHIILLPYKLT